MNYIFIIVIVYVLTGLGRGMVVINLSADLISIISETKPSFKLDNQEFAAISTAVMIGSMISSMFCYLLIKYLGRKYVILIGAFLGILSNFTESITNTWIELFVLRFISGFSSVLLTTVVPMLFSEYLQPELRGIFAAFINIFTTIGTLFSNLIMLFIIYNKKFYYYSFIPGSILSLFCFAFALFIKENKTGVTGEVKEQKISIFERKYRKCLILSFALGIYPGGGINCFVNYATLLFRGKLSGLNSGVYGAIIVTSLNSFATIFTSFFIKKLNRRLILKIGLTGQLVSYIVFVIAEFVQNSEKEFELLLIACVIYMCFFEMSYGELYNPLYSEIFPTEIKAIMMNVTEFILWTSINITTFIFPLINKVYSYILYTCVVSVSFALLMIYLPETQNRTLEEINVMITSTSSSHKEFNKNKKQLIKY